MSKGRNREGILWIVMSLGLFIFSAALLPNVYSVRDNGGALPPDQSFITWGISLICLVGVGYGIYKLRKK
jgi:hypothetical protein